MVKQEGQVNFSGLGSSAFHPALQFYCNIFGYLLPLKRCVNLFVPA